MVNFKRALGVVLCLTIIGSTCARAEAELIPGRLVAVKAVIAPEKKVPQRGYLITGTVTEGIKNRSGEALIEGIAWLNGSTQLRPNDRISILLSSYESSDSMCQVLKAVSAMKECEISEVDNYSARKLSALVELSPRHKRLLRNEGVTLNGYPESTLIKVASGDYLGVGVVVAAPTPVGIILANNKGEYQVLPIDKSPGVGLFKRGN